MIERHGLTEVYLPPEGKDTVALYVVNTMALVVLPNSPNCPLTCYYTI